MHRSWVILIFQLTRVAFSQDALFSYDNNICIGERATLYYEGADTSLSWSNANDPDSILGTDYFLIVYPEETSTYLLYSSTDTMSIRVYVTDTDCRCRYYVPNIFTPDGDVFNDKFTPIINCDHIGLHMTIYSRAQNIVYDSQELYQSWDGTHYETGNQLEDDVYVYQVSFMKSDGEIVRLVGFVLLTR